MTQNIVFVTKSAKIKVRGWTRDVGHVSSLLKAATFGEAFIYAIRTNDHL